MFQFRRFPSIAYVFSYGSYILLYRRFPHSEICGSMDICSLPQLIAACHVLRRLPVPRHSPCALSSLTFMLESSRVVRNCMFTDFHQLPIIIFHISYHLAMIQLALAVYFFYSVFKVQEKKRSFFSFYLFGLTLQEANARIFYWGPRKIQRFCGVEETAGLLGPISTVTAEWSAKTGC